MLTRRRRFMVLIEESGQRVAAGFSAFASESRVAIALQLRKRGWDPYRVAFDDRAEAWVGYVLSSKKAA